MMSWQPRACFGEHAYVRTASWGRPLGRCFVSQAVQCCGEEDWPWGKSAIARHLLLGKLFTTLYTVAGQSLPRHTLLTEPKHKLQIEAKMGRQGLLRMGVGGRHYR